MAKEKFEDRRLTGTFSVTCKYENAPDRVWSARKEDIVSHILDIVEEYEDLGYVLTLRQLHYQLVTNNWIINHDTAYKKLGKILDDCKYAGIIDWESIEDRGRVPYIPYAVRDVEHALQDTIDQYRINRQDGQKNHIELWTEKDALSGILRRSTSKYHVQLVVNKGYTSSSAVYQAYQRVMEALERTQRTIILYFGDHDPSGLDMIRDIRDRLSFMIEKGKYSDGIRKHSPNFDASIILNVVPIGLTMEQIKQYDLPYNPTKMTDTRSANYVREFGKTCWEVDALKPQVLTQIVETNIERYMKMDLYEKRLVLENKGIDELKGIVKNRKKKK